MITPDGWLVASNSQANCVGVRRLTRSSDIHLRETDNAAPKVSVTSLANWRRLEAGVRDGVFDVANLPKAPVGLSHGRWVGGLVDSSA